MSAPADGTTAEVRVAVYFDGSCPLCRSEVAIYRRRSDPATVGFVDVSDEATALPADLDRQTALSRFHVRGPDGTLLSGAAAFAALWRRTPGFRWLGRIASLPGVSLVFEGGYRAFLLVRPAAQGLFRRLAGSRSRSECETECR